MYTVGATVLPFMNERPDWIKVIEINFYLQSELIYKIYF